MMGASLNTTLSKLLVYLHNLTVFKNVELWIKHFGYVIDNCSSRMLNFSGTTEKHPEV